VLLAHLNPLLTTDLGFRISAETKRRPAPLAGNRAG